MNVVLLALLLLVQGIVVPVAETGTVSGRVLNMDGTPAAHVRVAAQAVAESPAAAAEAPVLSSIVQTDAKGNYRLEGVIPGRFYITAGLVDLPTYYPGVTSIGDARVVAVAGGSAVTEIDFKMGRPTGLTVRGHVKLEDGATMPPSTRVLMTGGGVATNRTFILPADGDGTFEFDAVSPGRYTIGVSPANGMPPQQIVVNDKDVDVELAIKPTVALSGTVVVEGGGPRPRVNLQFRSGATIAVSVGVASTGTFNVQIPLGSYRLSVSGIPPGYRLKSVTAGSMDWIKDEIVAQLGTPSLQFTVALDVDSPPPWVKVKGHLTPTAAGVVVTMTGTNAGEILHAEVADDGSFEFQRVIPGPYIIRPTGPVAVVGAPSLQITVGSTDLENLELRIPRIVSVTGRVIVESGGLPRVTRLSFMTSGNAVSNRIVTAVPNSNGVFSLSLPDGEYSLSFDTQLNNLPGYTVKSVTYGATSLLAAMVKISSNDANKELVVTLEKSGPSGVKISGRVTNLPGNSAQVSILGASFNIGGPNAIPTDTNGVFEIPDVPPGAFTLRAFAVTAGIDVSATVNVPSGKDLSGIEIPFPPQHEVSGNVVLDSSNGKSPFPRFWVILTGSRTITAYPKGQADGSFTVRLPLGEWSVKIEGLPTDVTLQSISYGDKNLLAEKIEVAANDTLQLRLVVSPK